MFKGFLIRLSIEYMQLNVYITLKKISEMSENEKMINVKHLMVGVPYSYKIIIGKHVLNLLGAYLLTLYLSMKYFLPIGRLE